MTPRTVSKVVFAEEREMEGLRVRQPLPSADLSDLDPFVLLHHGGMTPGGPGRVGTHPHRGFSPVTFVFGGAVRHRDSEGHDATVGAGGAQWMHAGAGILHAEEAVLPATEIVQLWVNTPAAHKMDPPTYTPLSSDQLPVVVPGEGARAHVVAGTLGAVMGPVSTFTPITAAMLTLHPQGRAVLPAPADRSAFLYLLDGGAACADGTSVQGPALVTFNPDGDAVSLEALAQTRALFMSGTPLGEPVVVQGPFVMNTADEIRRAWRDFAAGRMGRIA